MLDRRAWQYLLLASVGKCQGGQAKLQLTGHLKLEPSFSQGSSYMTSLCLFLGGGSVSNYVAPLPILWSEKHKND